MGALLADLAAIVLPVFAVAALGYGWVKAGQPFDQPGLGKLVYNVATPCLIFSVLTTNEHLALGELGAIAGLTALYFALLLPVCAGLVTLARQPRPAGVSLLAFANAGNMGLPVCLFAFGEAGLGLAAGFFAISTLVHFSAGVIVMAGRLHPGFLLRQPVLYAVLLGAGVRVAGLEVAAPIANTIGLVGDLAVPLMLLSLGAALAGVPLGALRRGAAYALARPLVGLGLAGGLVLVLPVTGLTAKILMLQASMPSAVMTYVFAQHHQREPDLVATAIFLSTLAALVYVPVILAFML